MKCYRNGRPVWVNVLNPRMMSVCDNDNRHTYIQIYRSQNAHTYIKSAQMKWNRKEVLGVHVLNPRMMSIGDNDNRHIYRHIYIAKMHTLI